MHLSRMIWRFVNRYLNVSSLFKYRAFLRIPHLSRHETKAHHHPVQLIRL